MSFLFMYVHFCHEVHMRILHLPTAICPWWHSRVALGLFQWSHTQACRISPVMPGTSLPCCSLSSPCWTECWSCSWQQEATGICRACWRAWALRGIWEPMAWVWSQMGNGGESKRSQVSPAVINRWCEEPVKCNHCSQGLQGGKIAAWYRARGQPL